jgi:hypothetical protein
LIQDAALYIGITTLISTGMMSAGCFKDE